MIIQHQPPLHLTYCLNIHPGESWAENFAALQEKVLAVKERVAPGQWFGLGLRIARQAAAELTARPELRAQALAFFHEHQLYPFSINGFPYGQFHAGPVKESVYAPDWRSPARLHYSLELADLLASWLPIGMDGSISTVPGSFKSWITTDSDRDAIVDHLAAAVAYLSALHEDTGREIHLGLEPEPACFLETTAETIDFFENHLFTGATTEVARILKCYRSDAEVLVRRHLGVCFDTCHVALQYEDLATSFRAYRQAGIRISKVQISAALQARATPESFAALAPFAEPVYLHQVKARDRSGAPFEWVDLPAALAEAPLIPDLDTLRVHFHVPLFFTENGPLFSTSNTLTPEFFRELRSGTSPHLEIETYTFDVLPPGVHPGDLVESIAREYAWLLPHLQ